MEPGDRKCIKVADPTSLPSDESESSVKAKNLPVPPPGDGGALSSSSLGRSMETIGECEGYR